MLTGLKESSLACKCVFYRPERNPKGEPHGIEFWRFWNAEIQYTNGYTSKSRWKKMELLVSLSCLPLDSWSLKCQKWFIFVFFWWQHKISHNLGKLFKCIWKILFNSFRKCYGLLSSDILLVRYQLLKTRDFGIFL